MAAKRHDSLLHLGEPVPKGRVLTNLLLATLDADAYERVRPALRIVPLAFNQVLYRQGAPIHRVWFPGGGAVSVVRRVRGGRPFELAAVGRQGALGGTAVFGLRGAYGDAVVQVPDTEAYVMSQRAFQDQLRQDGSFKQRLLAQNHALSVLLTQSAACNHFHAAHARLARWLLIVHDCVEQPSFPITREYLAMMLAVGVDSTTRPLDVLAARRAIHYANSELTVRSRQALEASACECYRTIRRQFDKVLQ